MVKLRFRRLLFWVILLYSLAMLGVVTFQRDLMYHPDPQMEAPAHYGLAQAKQIALEAADGMALVAWLTPPKDDKPLIVFFHGNAQNLGARINKLRAFAETGMGVLALSYRGYGGSGGTPSERGLYEDARAAIAYATDTLQIPTDRLIFYGESLGTGVAVQMASELTPALLVLEAPYTSTTDRGAELYPWLPVRFLMLDRFESLKKIPQVKAPLLIFHNTGDAVIPIADGKKLYAAANKPKRAIWFTHNGHADFNWNRLAREIEGSYSLYQKTSP